MKVSVKHSISVASLVLAFSGPSAAESLGMTQAQSADAPQHPSIFVVFDIGMESDVPAAANAKKPQGKAQERAYQTISTHLKTWAEANGIELDTAVFSNGKKIDLKGRTFTYLVVEKITQVGLDEASGNAKISTRKWKIGRAHV